MLAALLLIALAVQDRAPIFPSPDEAGDAAMVPKRPCRPGSDTITVCGNRGGSRLPTLDEARWAEKPLRPDFRLPGGGGGTVAAVQRELPGARGLGLMATATIPLGRKPKQREDDAK
ncbi:MULTISPECIES: hypothetical protein [unclassified Sphingomonas]|uniref:hypothetical protein n=1 Tax=Sphingomonas TaxID=13687 RepID=UPI0009628B3F|nr:MULTISPECIES: hypothetical protein [unclassified Sphingomonas]MBN8809918.1 hypothetical protein [Sphingomonas sp.]OJY50526.1 MAG: hypothetical protein BGP17_18970 [Sphingomonas sp. 67-41]